MKHRFNSPKTVGELVDSEQSQLFIFAIDYEIFTKQQAYAPPKKQTSTKLRLDMELKNNSTN